jgi:hypothetical protein
MGSRTSGQRGSGQDRGATVRSGFGAHLLVNAPSYARTLLPTAGRAYATHPRHSIRGIIYLYPSVVDAQNDSRSGGSGFFIMDPSVVVSDDLFWTLQIAFDPMSILLQSRRDHSHLNGVCSQVLVRTAGYDCGRADPSLGIYSGAYDRRGPGENATLPRAGGPLKVRGWCVSKTVGRRPRYSTGLHWNPPHNDAPHRINCSECYFLTVDAIFWPSSFSPHISSGLRSKK